MKLIKQPMITNCQTEKSTIFHLSIQFVIQIPAPAVLPGYRFVIHIFNAAILPEENLYYNLSKDSAFLGQLYPTK